MANVNADRTMKRGDSYPALKGQASDENGLVDLTTAQAMTVFIKSGSTLISGVPEVIDPPEVDADGVHIWNWQYPFEAGDTDVSSSYKVELKVTWGTGQFQTFPSTGTSILVIEDSLG